jgi:hypothetical protein
MAAAAADIAAARIALLVEVDTLLPAAEVVTTKNWSV